MLANVGLVVAHSQHHLHAYYVIRNSELAGLTDNEIEVIAQIARYHRKSEPKQSHEAFAALSASDQRLVRSLAGVLRVAIGLDRRHDGRVAAVDAAPMTLAASSSGRSPPTGPTSDSKSSRPASGRRCSTASSSAVSKSSLPSRRPPEPSSST